MKSTSGKMSEIMCEMSKQLLRDPDGDHSEFAEDVALMLANVAWNESVGVEGGREAFRSAHRTLTGDDPKTWKDFKSANVNVLIDELVAYKNKRYPDDERRILVCGVVNGEVRVEWLPPADPGADSTWEMTLFGLVRCGEREQAIEFLRQTRRLSRAAAAKRVKQVASNFGMS